MNKTVKYIALAVLLVATGYGGGMALAKYEDYKQQQERQTVANARAEAKVRQDQMVMRSRHDTALAQCRDALDDYKRLTPYERSLHEPPTCDFNALTL